MISITKQELSALAIEMANIVDGVEARPSHKADFQKGVENVTNFTNEWNSGLEKIVVSFIDKDEEVSFIEVKKEDGDFSFSLDLAMLMRFANRQMEKIPTHVVVNVIAGNIFKLMTTDMSGSGKFMEKIKKQLADNNSTFEVKLSF